MSVLGEKTRLYQASLEERRRRRTNLDESWSLVAERDLANVEREVLRTREEMETAWVVGEAERLVAHA